MAVDDTSSATKPIASAFISTVSKLTAKPGEETFAAEWKYTNHWDFPLTVERFDTSCGCLSGKTDQPALAPGESGTLRAAFSPGNHRGLLRKSLHVRFIGHENPVELVVDATIPTHVELSTQELVWGLGESAEAKIIEVTSGTGKPFAITDLLGVSDSQYQIRKEAIKGGTHYRVHLTPVGQPAPGIQILQIRTDSPDPRDQVKAVFLRTAEPTPEAAKTTNAPAASVVKSAP